VDQYRKARRVEVREQQVERLPEVSAVERGKGPDLEALLAELPQSQREVVVMLKVSGMSLEEVARATASSVGSVKQKAHRAYDKLRELLTSAGFNK
jgi:RNA polymerase sigma-70 factor (ECF subfamily)